MKILISPIDETGIKYAVILHVDDAKKIVDAINSGKERHIRLQNTDPNGYAYVNNKKVAIRIPSQGGGTGYFDKQEILELLIQELTNQGY